MPPIYLVTGLRDEHRVGSEARPSAVDRASLTRILPQTGEERGRACPIGKGTKHPQGLIGTDAEARAQGMRIHPDPLELRKQLLQLLLIGHTGLALLVRCHSYR